MQRHTRISPDSRCAASRGGSSHAFAMKNKYIGLRLGTAFAALIVILVAIGQFGLRRMHEINQSLSDITGRQTAKLQLAERALDLSNRNSRITMEIFLVKDGALTDTLLAARAENSKKIAEVMAEIEGRCESVQEKLRLSAVRETRKPYIDSYVRALHLLVDKKDRDAASAIMVNETLPLLVRYHAAWYEFLNLQKNEVDVAITQAQLDYVKTHHLAYLLILLAVLLALGIAVVTTSQAQTSYRQQIVAREGVELELERSEERMRRAMEGAKIGCWDWDILRDEQVWSDTCKSLLGLGPESIANFQVLMNSIHPDDRKMMEERIKAAVEEKKDYSSEFRVVWPDGSVHWQSAKGQAFYDETGRATRVAGIAMDIDVRKRAEERLHLQAAALEAAANAIVITDSHGTILWVNPAFTTMTGYSQEEVLGKNPRLLKSGEQSKNHYNDLWSTITSGKVWNGEIVNRRKDGTTYTEEMTITPVRNAGDPANGYFIAIKQDITERKQIQEALRQAEEKYRAIFEDAVVGIFQTTPDGRPLSVNRALAEMHGYDSPEQLLASVSNVALQLFADPGRLSELGQALAKNGIVRGAEVEVYCKNGTKKWVMVNLRAVHDAGGNIVLHEGTIEDITSRKVAEEQVQYLAYYDALTGLPNRTLLKDRLAKALASARRRKDKVAILFFDLDQFKNVNDSLGHSVGDLLLQEVAVRLKTWATGTGHGGPCRRR